MQNNDGFNKCLSPVNTAKPKENINLLVDKLINVLQDAKNTKNLATSIATSITNSDDKIAKILKEALKKALYKGFILDISIQDSCFVEILITKFEQFRNLSVEKPSLEIWQYNKNKWNYIEPSELKNWIVKTAVKEMQDGISSSKTNSVFNMFHSCLSTKPERRSGLIAFNNTVLDMRNNKMCDHHENLGIQSIINSNYDPNDNNIFNFKKYIEHCCKGNPERKRLLYAGIYYVLACRYDKKMFLELTGKSDTGKSTLVDFLVSMVGEENTATLSLDALDGKNKDRHALETVVNASLITYPETCKLFGEFETLKSMTGGDNIRINPKNKKAYQTKIRATHVVVGNNPLSIPENTSANFSRRLLIYFDNVVETPDPDLINKLKNEASGIVNLLMREMTETKFNAVLQESKYSVDKMAVMEETDAVFSWAKSCLIITENKNDFIPYGDDLNYKDNSVKRLLQVKTTLYQNYLLFCEYVGIKRIKRRVFPKSIEALFETKIKNANKFVKKTRHRKNGNDIYGLCGIKIKKDALHILKFEDFNR